MAKTTMRALQTWMRQTRNWRIISVRSMLSRFFQRLTMPYDSIYIRELGADPIQLGMVSSFAHVMSAFVSIPFGWLQDRYSLRRIFLIGVAFSLVVSLIYASATAWVMIIPAMLLSTLATKVGSCLTICDVSLKSEDRSSCKGICDGVFAAPSLIAPTLAALMITHFGGIGVKGIRPLYWTQLVAGVVLFFFLATQLTEIERPNVTSNLGFMEDYMEVFRKGVALKRWIIFAVVTSFSTAMVTPFQQPFAHEIKQADQFILGGMITASLAVQILFSASLGSMADTIGRKKVIYMTEPLYWASTLLLVFAPSPEFLIISSILGGFRMIASYVCMTPLMVELVPIEFIGRWRGILGLFQALISIPAPIIGGIIWETIGPSYLFLILILISILVSIPILTTIPERMRS
jgi:MFS family permease